MGELATHAKTLEDMAVVTASWMALIEEHRYVDEIKRDLESIQTQIACHMSFIDHRIAMGVDNTPMALIRKMVAKDQQDISMCDALLPITNATAFQMKHHK